MASQPTSKTSMPYFFVYGDGDRDIPVQALGFMAERARSWSNAPHMWLLSRIRRQSSI